MTEQVITAAIAKETASTAGAIPSAVATQSQTSNLAAEQKNEPKAQPRTISQKDILDRIEEFNIALDKLAKTFNLNSTEATESFLDLDDSLISFETKVQFLHEYWDKKYSEIMQRQKQQLAQ